MKEKKVLAIIGESADKKTIQALEELGFQIIILPADERLASPISAHADVLLCVIAQTVFCELEYYEKNKYILKPIEAYGYSIVKCKLDRRKEYPYDIQLNQAVTGRYILGKKSACAKEILDFAKDRELEYLSVKQGYAKCSSLILNESSVICADDGIINALNNINISSQKIENGVNEIMLNGYDYGFIGGASAVYEKTVYFFGDVSRHRDYERIKKFCSERGFTLHCLSNGALTDIGGAFFLPSLSD